MQISPLTSVCSCVPPLILLQFISLPQTWVTLNGSSSHDDHRIVAYTWHCVDGPTNSTIVGYNESVANATGLTKGQYVFSLTVLDDNGNSATDNVTVTVTQSKFCKYVIYLCEGLVIIAMYFIFLSQ